MIFTVDLYKSFLNRSCVDVDPTDEEIAEIAEEMLKAVDGVGVGLAANQLGYKYNLAVMQLDKADSEPGKREHMTITCNPEILIDASHGKNGQIVTREGCLSIPDKIYLVPRSRYVTLVYYNLMGEMHRVKLEGYPAVIAQHEWSHLQGQLISDIGKPCVEIQEESSEL